MKKKLNYMWVIVVTCFIMEFVALGFCSSNKSLYLGAITEALNIPRSLFAINDSIRFLTTAVINLFFGTLVKKLGARKMVAIGFLCLIGSTQVYAHAESVFASAPPISSASRARASITSAGVVSSSALSSAAFVASLMSAARASATARM